MKLKRAIAWAVAALALALVALYGVVVYHLLDDDPVSLVACVKVEAGWLAWSCKQVLRHASLTPEQVHELNTRAGAAAPVSLLRSAEAEDMLTLFLARGVNINAPDRQAHDWTALHGFAANGDIAAAKLVLKHGARTDVRDKEGRTPLDVARGARQKFPNNPNHEEMLRLLEAAQRPAGRE
jgi:Ankyrin repeats (3 copies)